MGVGDVVAEGRGLGEVIEAPVVEGGEREDHHDAAEHAAEDRRTLSEVNITLASGALKVGSNSEHDDNHVHDNRGDNRRARGLAIVAVLLIAREETGALIVLPEERLLPGGAGVINHLLNTDVEGSAVDLSRGPEGVLYDAVGDRHRGQGDDGETRYDGRKDREGHEDYLAVLIKEGEAEAAQAGAAAAVVAAGFDAADFAAGRIRHIHGCLRRVGGRQRE